MDGERMTKIYVQVCLGQKPTLETEEELDFYNSLIKELHKKTNGDNANAILSIPSE